MYLIISYFHMTFAALAVTGFLLRGYWRMTGSPLYKNRAAKILQWTQHAWLLAKFAGLAGYIGFGMVAFRFGKTSQIRLIAFVAAVASFAFIVGAALTKSPLSWLAL